MFDEYNIDLGTREVIMRRDKRQMVINMSVNRLKYIRRLYKILYTVAIMIAIINIIFMTKIIPMISIMLVFIAFYLRMYYYKNRNNGILM
jgi:phosphatidylserine synthase